jgi:protoporphyrin/coproporphyrin ferrochelatase
MRTGVLLLNFGEPEQFDTETVIQFLERIFIVNAPLMGQATPEQVRARSRKLAEDRAPGLIEEYEEIGGSPLHRQATEQGDALAAELRRRGHDVHIFLGMQFTEPSIADAVRAAREAGVDRIVAMPVYPLPGPSTTFAALEELERELASSGWTVPVHQVSGWHRHPEYVRFRAESIRAKMQADGVSFDDPGTRLVFSAHGTPLKYIEEGSHYGEYVVDFCAAVARELGVSSYEIGYQNHANRPGVAWTQPDVDRVIESIEAERVVVDPVSFMHEQSETLAELDHELREEAEERGLGFHRVPIRHAAPEFVALLAGLVESALGVQEQPATAATELRPCRCKPTEGTFCVAAPPREVTGNR